MFASRHDPDTMFTLTERWFGFLWQLVVALLGVRHPWSHKLESRWSRAYWDKWNARQCVRVGTVWYGDCRGETCKRQHLITEVRMKSGKQYVSFMCGEERVGMSKKRFVATHAMRPPVCHDDCECNQPASEH